MRPSLAIVFAPIDSEGARHPKGGRGKRRVRGAPAARVQQKMHTVVTTGTQDTRRFLRNGFNGLCHALPGDEFVLPPSLTN